MKFSIIVPVFGIAQYLRTCLNSVAKQSYKDWECICVDDGSLDDSSIILDEYAANDCRYYVVKKNNEGVAIARNTALDSVQGSFYLFLDGDDIWHPDLLNVCKSALDEYQNADIIHFGYQNIDEKLDYLPLEQQKNYFLSVIDGKYDYFKAGFTACNKAFRRSVFGELRQCKYIVGEDLLYLTRVYLLAKNEVKVNAILYGYRMHSASVMHRRPTLQIAIDSISFLHDIVDTIKSSRRHMTVRTAHWLSCAMTEQFSYYYYYRVYPRNKVRQVWCEALSKSLENRDFSLFQRLRMKIIFVCPYWPINFLFCIMPILLKRIRSNL